MLRRFEGEFIITPKEQWQEWEISLEGFPSPIFYLYLSPTRRKVEGKHPRFGYWSYWVQSVFHHELGLKWKGRIGDEGVEKTWAPEEGAYPSFSDYIKELNPSAPLREALLSEIPNCLQHLKE